MSEGFFSDSDLPEVNTAPATPRCGLCGLYKSCLSPKMGWTGKGKRKVLICAEAPGEDEDKEGTQLIGKAGQRLRKHMNMLGWDLDEDCWKTNSVICRPPDGEMEDKYIESCRPCLNKTIQELNPRIIILLGASSIKSLIPVLYDKDSDPGPMFQWAGFAIPSQKLNTWVCCTYHPSYLLRKPNPVLDFWFSQHLKTFFELRGRPWPEGVPNFSSQVECLYSPREAASRLNSMVQKGGTFAFDYETNMLKPDSPKARIVSCAVCRDGEETVSFPWVGEAVDAMFELLRSDFPKWGWNIKFEHRWTKSAFKVGVRRWEWDGMLAAHVIDNRPGITRAKLQGFLMLGQENWEGLAAPYLSAEGGNAENKIDQMDLRDLLKYNGMDAVIEWQLCKRQRELMGVT